MNCQLNRGLRASAAAVIVCASWSADAASVAQPSSATQSTGPDGAGISQPQAEVSNRPPALQKQSNAKKAADPGEIVITARKRSERLHDVPFSVSALTGAQLERTGATGLQDYLAQVPGVTYNNNGRGRSDVVIRGVSTSSTLLGQNQQKTVELFLDDLPLYDRFLTWSDPDFDTFDLERVEVLRGPQGTLFGSGAMGGAIRLITAKPDLNTVAAKFEFGGALVDGGDADYSAKTMVNVPLVDGRAAVRMVGYIRHDGGWTDNIRTGQRNVNSGTTTGGRAMLALQPNDDLAVRLTVFHEQAKNKDSDRTFLYPTDGRYDQFNGLLPENLDSNTNIYNLNINYTLGSTVLTSSSTYGTRDAFLRLDFMRDVLDPSTYIDNRYFNDSWLKSNTKRAAQEFRWASSGTGPLQWTLGAFWMDYHARFVQELRFQDPATDPAASFFPAPLNLFDQHYKISLQETALFGESTYKLTPKWALTAGARIFWDKYQFQVASLGINDISTPNTVQRTKGVVNPRFSVSYTPTRDLNIYVNAAKGYRIGQVNYGPNVPTTNPTYGPDSLWNYEVGLKGNWLHHTLITNLAAFYIDWKDIQLYRFVPPFSNPIENAGTARIKGFEAEIEAHPTSFITLGTDLTQLDAKLVSVLPGVQARVGSRLPGSPRWSAYSHIDLNFRGRGSVDSYYFILSHQYVGEVTGAIVPPSFPSTSNSQSYNLFNARAGMKFGPYEVAAFVENIANSHRVTNVLGESDPVAAASRLRPRTIGMRLTANF